MLRAKIAAIQLHEFLKFRKKAGNSGRARAGSSKACLHTMDSSPAAKSSAIRPFVQWQMDESVLSTPEDRVKKKLFDLDDDGEDVELNQWSSSSEYFSQSSRENSCSMSEGFSQSNLFDDSPSTKVCVTVCVCVCVCVCV